MVSVKKLVATAAIAGTIVLSAACGDGGTTAPATAPPPPRASVEAPSQYPPPPPQPTRTPEPVAPAPYVAPARRKGIRTAFVYKVLDGDTAILNVNVVVRLANIDAPEKSQRYGVVASNKLLELCCAGEQLWVEIVNVDRYGRIIANVWSPPYEGAPATEANTTIERSINYKMLALGLAHSSHVQEKYRKAILQVEHSAKVTHKGIWAEREVVPPQSYRNHQSGRNNHGRGENDRHDRRQR